MEFLWGFLALCLLLPFLLLNKSRCFCPRARLVGIWSSRRLKTKKTQTNRILLPWLRKSLMGSMKLRCPSLDSICSANLRLNSNYCFHPSNLTEGIFLISRRVPITFFPWWIRTWKVFLRGEKCGSFINPRKLSRPFYVVLQLNRLHERTSVDNHFLPI